MGGERTALEIALVFNTGRIVLPLIMKELSIKRSLKKKNNVEMLLSHSSGADWAQLHSFCPGFLCSYSLLGSLTHLFSSSWAGKTEQPETGAAGLLSLREVLRGGSELSL